MKDGNLIQSGDHTKIKGDEEDSTLSIRSTKESDAGNYTCIAKNAFGSDSFTARLLIQGKDGANPLSITKLLLLIFPLKHRRAGFRSQMMFEQNGDRQSKSPVLPRVIPVRAYRGEDTQVLAVHQNSHHSTD